MYVCMVVSGYVWVCLGVCLGVFVCVCCCMFLGISVFVCVCEQPAVFPQRPGCLLKWPRDTETHLLSGGQVLDGLITLRQGLFFILFLVPLATTNPPIGNPCMQNTEAGDEDCHVK